MVIDKKILDELTASANASPRLRMNLDFRNGSEDQSQRMLNALEPGTERVVLDANGEPRMLNVEKDRWHSLECLESGSVLYESKDGPYHPLEEDEVMVK